MRSQDGGQNGRLRATPSLLSPDRACGKHDYEKGRTVEVLWRAGWRLAMIGGRLSSASAFPADRQYEEDEGDWGIDARAYALLSAPVPSIYQGVFPACLVPLSGAPGVILSLPKASQDAWLKLRTMLVHPMLDVALVSSKMFRRNRRSEETTVPLHARMNIRAGFEIGIREYHALCHSCRRPDVLEG